MPFQHTPIYVEYLVNLCISSVIYHRSFHILSGVFSILYYARDMYLTLQPPNYSIGIFNPLEDPQLQVSENY